LRGTKIFGNREKKMKFFDLEVQNYAEKRSVTLRVPWIHLTLSFWKKIKQPVNIPNWFEKQMEAIRDGRRKHPAMMTLTERHQETANIAKNFRWSKGFLDYWGVREGYEAFLCHSQPQGSAVGFLSVLTVEEREELRKIVREEMRQSAKTEVERGEME
jgi:hypothetical protein